MKDQLKALGFKCELDEIVEYLMQELSDLSPYIYHTSKNSTVYIKFKEKGVNSLRIADHDNIEKYRYMWNLRLDSSSKHPWKEFDNGVTRYFYPKKCLNDLIEDISIFWAIGDRPIFHYEDN